MTTSIELSLKNYITDFRKVCRVSDLISRVCELQKRPALEGILLNKWASTVLDSQEYGESSFIVARSRFVKFLQSDKYIKNSPLALFLLDTLWLIY